MQQTDKQVDQKTKNYAIGLMMFSSLWMVALGISSFSTLVLVIGMVTVTLWGGFLGYYSSKNN